MYLRVSRLLQLSPHQMQAADAPVTGLQVISTSSSCQLTTALLPCLHLSRSTRHAEQLSTHIQGFRLDAEQALSPPLAQATE